MQLFLTSTEDSCELSEFDWIVSTARTGLCISEAGEESLQWLLDSVLRVACPSAVNGQPWSYILYDLLIQYSNDNRLTRVESFISELLRRCSMESARVVLWRLFDPRELWFESTTQPWSRPAFTRSRIFRLLLEKTGGVKSLHTPRSHRERRQSLLSYALQSSRQWRLFEQAISQSTFGVSELIRCDLDLYQSGWTEEGTWCHSCSFLRL